MPRTYEVVIEGNDQFYVTIRITCHNIELCLMEALKQRDAYAKCSHEQLRITMVEEL